MRGVTSAESLASRQVGGRRMSPTLKIRTAKNAEVYQDTEGDMSARAANNRIHVAR